MGGFRRLLIVAASAVVLVAGDVPTALAHATLIRSDPPDLCSPLAIPRVPPGDPRCAAGSVLTSPPMRVQLFFSEPVSLVGRSIRVIGPDGRGADRGPVRAAGPRLTAGVAAAQPGTYLVSWRVISADTHPSRGTFAFSVGRSSRPLSEVPGTGGAGSALGLALQALARWMHFIGYALGFGAFAFHVAVLRPLGLRGSEAERRVWSLVTAGVVLLLLAEPLAFLAQTSSLGTWWVIDPEVTSAALESSFGRVLAQRFGAALLLWVLLGSVRNGSARAAVGVAVLGLALACVDGEATHAIGTRPVWVGLGVNTLHLAAMGMWAGGVASLLGVWRLPELAAARGAAAVRTGGMSAAALGVLLVTGAVMAVQHLTAPGDVLASAYGRTLGLKLGMVCAALLLAVAAARRSPVERLPWWTREAAVLLGVLALAGLLVSLPPPR